MKVVFAGTPEFAHVALSRLLDTAHHVALVLTQPDRPAGRGLKLLPGPVKQAAQAAGISVIQPRSLRLDGKYPQDAQDAQQALLALQPDVMIVAAYGLILPKWVLDLPAYGCLNIHASLLPRWRGAAPIQRAIEAGDAQTGVCIMQMDEGLDTGDIVRRAALPITPRHTAARLHDELAELGAQVLLETLDDLSAKGRLPAQPQATTGITYAAKLSKTEATLDWALPAEVLERRIRAFNPVPGASATLPGLKDAIKIWQAQALPEHDPKRNPRPAGVLQIDQTALTTNQSASLAVYGEVKRGHCNMEPKAPLTCGEEAPTPRSEFFTPAVPGKVLSVSPKGIDIATGAGILRLLILQKAGGKRLPVADFVHGWDGCCDRHG